MVAAQPQELSILIVTWNSVRWIDRCLASIPPACGDLEHEIIVYDNASSDDTLQAIGDREDLLIRSEHNDGFGIAVNRAVQRSRGRYVFLLNPDCELAPGALKLLHDFMEAHPNVAAAAPLLANDDGGSQREFQLRRLPTLGSLAAEIFAIGRFFPRATARHRYRDLDLTRPQRVEQPAGAALMIRREVFDEIGPFDEQFSPAWFEDVDYCARLKAAGKEVWVVPAAAARHVGGASLEHLSFAEFQAHWYRNMWRYAQKWLRAGEAEALRWTIIAGMALRVVAALIGVAHRNVGPLRAARA
ncbi:MAG TPA: glycosyltransferase family 2 protein, partial [Thermoanaerobaculia bacterium]|nr:glycosyltransferase family 2 protein [Thermoanaerobaculia bacterium]